MNLSFTRIGKLRLSRLMPFVTLVLLLLLVMSIAAAQAENARHTTTGVASQSMLFDDEFNGTQLDTSRWNAVATDPESPPVCCLAFGLEAWLPRNVAVTDGSLLLISRSEPFADKSYTSGAVTTEGKFSFLYGRVDIRARLPQGQGLWPAFWLLPVNQSSWDSPWKAPYEIDIMEMLGQQPNTVYMTNNWNDAADQEQCRHVGPNFAADYHVFSLVWSPTAITWYIDGVQRCQVTEGVSHTPMYLILNVAVGGSWPGAPDDSTSFPQAASIDYVRVSQQR
jgi:beta-glucanase (GH16 family)